GKIATGSIDVKMSLGKIETGESAGFLALKEEAPRADLADPGRLQTFVNHGVEVIRDGAVLRQVKAPQTLAMIVPLADGYEIRFHASNDGRDVNGDYIASGLPDAISRIESPNQDPTHLRITQWNGADSLVSEFRWSPADQAWELTLGDVRKEMRSIVERDGLRTETFRIRSLDDVLVHQETRTWRESGGELGDL